MDSSPTAIGCKVEGEMGGTAFHCVGAAWYAAFAGGWYGFVAAEQRRHQRAAPVNRQTESASNARAIIHEVIEREKGVGHAVLA